MESKRKKQRNELEATKKELENEFRIAQGLEPLGDGEEDDTKKSEDEEEDPQRDIILMESSRILNDLIVPVEATAELQTVKK